MSVPLLFLVFENEQQAAKSNLSFVIKLSHIGGPKFATMQGEGLSLASFGRWDDPKS